MNGSVKPGATFTYTMKAEEDMSAARFQDSSPPVFATPFLVGAVEAAAARLMEPCLGEGQMSVGGYLEISHTAPTPIGWEVKTIAELMEAKGKKFVFSVECFDEAGKIGTAKHTRFVIDAEPFMAMVDKKAAG